MTSPHPRPDPHGFTLLELLATISIIAMLAALSIPAIGKARQAAEKSTCLANLRQLGLGLRSYAQENGGVLPLSLNPDPLASNSQVSWQILIQRELNVAFPQAGQRSVFICPSAARTYPQAPYRTYGLNLTGDSPTANPPRLLTLSAPSRSALVVETKYETNGAGYGAISGSLTGVGGKGRLEARHSDMMNMLMADGSVRQLRTDDPELDELLQNIRK